MSWFYFEKVWVERRREGCEEALILGRMEMAGWKNDRMEVVAIAVSAPPIIPHGGNIF